MAFHQPQIHMPIPKVLPSAANRITIPFHPLLKQIAAVLHFPEPVYHMLDLSKNRVYVSVETDIELPPGTPFTLTYVGGCAATVEESCELAAEKIVHNLITRWGVIVEDLTFENCAYLERCNRLYSLKRKELGSFIKGEDGGDLDEHVPPNPAHVARVFMDYMPLLRRVFRAIAVQCTPLETVKHGAGRYRSWIQVQPLLNNASAEVFIGPSCDTIAWAKSYLAKKILAYLIPAYNLEIVDANYGSWNSKSSTLLGNLEMENLLLCCAILEKNCARRPLIGGGERTI